MRRSSDDIAAFLTAQAERMRLTPTPCEQRLWERLEPLGFIRQRPYIGQTKNGLGWTYILDFYKPYNRVAIEVDGGVHSKKRGRDRRRDTRLAVEGIRTIRVSNREVEHDLDGVVARIKAALE